MLVAKDHQVALLSGETPKKNLLSDPGFLVAEYAAWCGVNECVPLDIEKIKK